MNKAFESRVRRTGQRLFQLIGDEVPLLFHKASWAGRVIAQCARDDGFKAEFIRFVDVLPSLTQVETVAEHLVEYFGRPEQRVPSHLKLRYTSPSPASLRGAESVSREIQDMMKAFITAATPEDALPVLVGRHPFGGFKMSGGGSKTGGPDYLVQFMVPRNVVENTLRRGFAPANL